MTESDTSCDHVTCDHVASVTSSDVERWLDDNVDWLCDYLQRRQLVLGRTAAQSRHTVPTPCRSESTHSPWHSRTRTSAVAVCKNVTTTSTTTCVTSSPHHHQQQQKQQQIERGVTQRTKLLTSSTERRHSSSPASLATSDMTSQVHISSSKTHLRRHFARSKTKMTNDDLSAVSASFDWSVSITALISHYTNHFIHHSNVVVIKEWEKILNH